MNELQSRQVAISMATTTAQGWEGERARAQSQSRIMIRRQNDAECSVSVAHSVASLFPLGACPLVLGFRVAIKVTMQYVPRHGLLSQG